MIRDAKKYLTRLAILSVALGLGAAALSRYGGLPVLLTVALGSGAAGAAAPFLFKDVKMN